MEFPEQVRPDGAICPHRLAVLEALGRGMYVPVGVLADYPDLEQKYPQLFRRYRREPRTGQGMPPDQQLAGNESLRSTAGDPRQQLRPAA